MDHRFAAFVSMMIVAVALAACGQREAVFPDAGGSFFGGTCGPGYPGGDAADAGADTEYAVEEGATFPCALWESARLAGGDIFINVAQVFLEAKHGVTDDKALVIVVSARNCGPCQALTDALAARRADLEAAGAFVVGMARSDLQAPTEPYFDLDEAYETMEDEGWPVEYWHVINDAEGYLPATFDSGTPWVVVADLSDMEVLAASNTAFSPNASGVEALISLVQGL
ncbi:MAG TPA: hypothetical protein VM285_02350 [Polyangia bacterium]|nr:hypothetical protein [Polyangia bacterium]